MEELQKQRKSEEKIKNNLARVLSIAEDCISLTKEGVFSSDIEYHYGDLDLNGPKVTERYESSGYGSDMSWSKWSELDPDNFKNTDGLKMPKTVGGSLDINGIISIRRYAWSDSFDHTRGGGAYFTITKGVTR